MADTKSRTGSSLVTVKKFVIGKFPVDAAKAPARILKAVNALKAAGALVSAAPAGRKGAHSFKLAKVDKAVTKVGLGFSKAAEPRVAKPKAVPKVAPKVAKPKAAKVGTYSMTFFLFLLPRRARLLPRRLPRSPTRKPPLPRNLPRKLPPPRSPPRRPA